MTFLVSLLVIISFILSQFSILSSIVIGSNVGIVSLIGAIIMALASLGCIFFAPESWRPIISPLIFCASMILCGWIIFNSDPTTLTPFIAVWCILSIFSAVFGMYSWVPILVISLILIALQTLSGHITSSNFINVIVSEFIPILFSPLIWRQEPNKQQQPHSLGNTLSQVSNKSEVIINAIGDGVIFIDNQNLIRLINPAAQEILGWTKQDALSLNYKSILKLVDQKDNPLPDNLNPVYKSLNENQSVRANKLTIISKNDKKIIVSLVISPVGEAGSGVIAVFRDITKETAEEREQAEFISTASHEMRTPVASIEGYLGLVLNPQTAQIDDRARDFITKAHASAQHLGRLFQDLLDVSKSEDGRMTNNPKVTNLIPFVKDVVEGLTPKATQKGLTVIYKPMPNNAPERILSPDYMVNLDNDHLNEVVSNLVENAIKYTPHGDITVDVTGDDEHTTISVADEGIGIPAEDIPHLFQKFYRVENKDTHDIGGTGLGLYLCRRLTELMGGRIWVESVRGQGSTFYVELPRLSEQEAKSMLEQEKNRQDQQAMLVNSTQETIQSEPTTHAEQANNTQELNQVPRGDALTPEQIAAYVAKQQALVASQNTNLTQGESENK